MNNDERLNPETETSDAALPSLEEERFSSAETLGSAAIDAAEHEAPADAESGAASSSDVETDAETAQPEALSIFAALAQAADAAVPALEKAPPQQEESAQQPSDESDLADLPEEATLDFEPAATDANAEVFFDPVDVDAALAAVATLDILAMPEDAAGEAAAGPEETETAPPRPLALPPLSRIQRGEAASVIPALLLIGLGGWLTFALTTTGSPLDATLLGGTLGAIFGLALLGYWFSSGRWAAGALFAGLVILFLGGAALLLAQPGVALPGPALPLFVLLLGLALLLTGIFAPRDLARLRFLGMLVIVIGLAAWLVGYGFIPESLTPLLSILLIPALLLILVVLLVPARRRDAE